jgi:hypothetical protein
MTTEQERNYWRPSAMRALKPAQIRRFKTSIGSAPVKSPVPGTVEMLLTVSNEFFKETVIWRRIANVWAAVNPPTVLRWMNGMSRDKTKIELLKRGCRWSFTKFSSNRAVNGEARDSSGTVDPLNKGRVPSLNNEAPDIGRLAYDRLNQLAPIHPSENLQAAAIHSALSVGAVPKGTTPGRIEVDPVPTKSKETANGTMPHTEGLSVSTGVTTPVHTPTSDSNCGYTGISSANP